MLSICIPVYNYNIRELIIGLDTQCSILKIEYEIICVDDCSSNSTIKSENELFIAAYNSTKVRYEALTNNLGRSAIRNYIVTKTLFDYCWFLDCDGKVGENNSLVKNFLQHLILNTVISGGRIYQKEIPEDELLRLHWTWASQRELIDVEKRMQQPIQHFLSNNFIAPKSVLLQIPFNEELSGYGYEDTFWASEVVQAGYKIQHINNPVVHEGLEINSVFLNKIEESVVNLLRLKNICIQKNIVFPVKSKLTKLAETLKQLFIGPLILYYLKANKNKYKSKLMSNKFNLFIFDLYRLALYIDTPKK